MAGQDDHPNGVGPKAPVVRIRRLRLASSVPMTLEDSWLPAERFPDLRAHDLHGSLYALMRDAYASPPVRATERLEPVLARPHEARALEVA